MFRTEDDVLNEMKRTFHQFYGERNRESELIREGKMTDDSVSIEEFRQAGIAEINKIYGK